MNVERIVDFQVSVVMQEVLGLERHPCVTTLMTNICCSNVILISAIEKQSSYSQEVKILLSYIVFVKNSLSFHASATNRIQMM